MHVGADPFEAVDITLTNFIVKCRASAGVQPLPVTAYQEWKQYIMSQARTYVADYAHKNGVSVDDIIHPRPNKTRWNSSKDEVYLSKKSLKYLRWLQQYLVMVPVDKASNNIAFICKRHYIDILRRELTGDEVDSKKDAAYVKSRESADDVVKRHLTFLKSEYKLEVPDRLPYLYWMPKLHKNPISERFIAASFQATTTSLSSILSDCLNKVLDKLREKDDEHIIRTGVRRFFVVKGFEEVSSFLSRWPRRHTKVKRKLYTGDFSTMYTTIPHADLVQQIRKSLQEAWQFVADKNKCNSSAVTLVWSGTIANAECSWETSKRGGRSRHDSKERIHQFICNDLIEAVTWLIDNTYLVNGDRCSKQQVGIPMGTNAAPPIANLFLYGHESSKIDKLLDEGKLDVALLFHLTFRLIDDVLSVDNEEFESECSNGLYPASLKLNDTSVVPDLEVNFLGMHIKSIDDSIHIDVFDKRREFPFRVVRYPHRPSLIPQSFPYGVFVGLLHRYYRICTDEDKFVQNALLLTSMLVKQGWSVQRLRKSFCGFIHSRADSLRWQCSKKRVLSLYIQQLEALERRAE